MTRDGLQAVLRSAVMDAIVALTVAPQGEPATASTRFVHQRWHWAESELALDFASVRAEVARRTSQLAGHNIPLTACPRLSGPGRPSAIVSRGGWLTACTIDGAATVRDLAWRNGSALYDTVEWVCELVREGLCSLEAPVDGTGTLSQDAGLAPGSPAAPKPMPVQAVTPRLPRRRPGASGTDVATRARLQELGTGANMPDPVHPDLLHRILHGLKRMS